MTKSKYFNIYNGGITQKIPPFRSLSAIALRFKAKKFKFNQSAINYSYACFYFDEIKHATKFYTYVKKFFLLDYSLKLKQGQSKEWIEVQFPCSSVANSSRYFFSFRDVIKNSNKIITGFAG